jgi:hypothetical protein
MLTDKNIYPAIAPPEKKIMKERIPLSQRLEKRHRPSHLASHACTGAPVYIYIYAALPTATQLHPHANPLRHSSLAR